MFNNLDIILPQKPGTSAIQLYSPEELYYIVAKIYIFSYLQLLDSVIKLLLPPRYLN